MVYLPSLTPSNFSSSAWSTHYIGLAFLAFLDIQFIWVYTHLAREVDLNGLDTDVLRARHGGGVNRGEGYSIEVERKEWEWELSN